MTAQAAPSPTRPADPIGPGLLGRALLTGLLAAAAATAYVVVEHHATAFLWEHLPEELGFDQVPWWWVVLLLVCGALLTAAALRLPGKGGHSPLDGFSFDTAGAVAVSLVAAAFASLAFGAVLGPEAPALAIGTATGALVAGAGRRTGDPDVVTAQRSLLMMAGGMAAFGAVLGNPLALAIFILEAALVARRTAGAPVTLAPVALALAAGYVLQVGVGPWAGLGEVVLSIPTVQPYPNVLAVDLLLAVPLAVALGVMIHIAFRTAGSFAAAVAGQPRWAILVAAALGMAVLALGARAIADVPLEFVLFSGQSGLPDVVTVTSVTVVLVAVAAKLLAYVLALESGFRGGAIFPAVFIGAALGTGIAVMVSPASVTGLVAAGVAAAVAATIRLPFSGAVLAVLLTSSAGLAVTSPALVASVVALLTVLLLDRRLGPRVVPPSPQSD
jgi:H+/Cl- antiporter ClcA